MEHLMDGDLLACGSLGTEWNHNIEGNGRQEATTSTIMLITVEDTKAAAFPHQRLLSSAACLLHALLHAPDEAHWLFSGSGYEKRSNSI
jgi:hypothetical protein